MLLGGLFEMGVVFRRRRDRKTGRKTCREVRCRRDVGSNSLNVAEQDRNEKHTGRFYSPPIAHKESGV